MEALLLEMPRTPKDKPIAPLRERRLDKHWSITTLSALSGVERTTIWRIESGKYRNMSNSTKQALAKALNLPVKAITEFVATDAVEGD